MGKVFDEIPELGESWFDCAPHWRADAFSFHAIPEVFSLKFRSCSPECSSLRYKREFDGMPWNLLPYKLHFRRRFPRTRSHCSHIRDSYRREAPRQQINSWFLFSAFLLRRVLATRVYIIWCLMARRHRYLCPDWRNASPSYQPVLSAATLIFSLILGSRISIFQRVQPRYLFSFYFISFPAIYWYT